MLHIYFLGSVQFKKFWPELCNFVIPGYFIMAKFVTYLIKYPDFDFIYLMSMTT